MAHYLPELEKIDTEWFELWGNTFGAPELVSAMLSNVRVRDRVARQMLHKSEVDLNASFSDVEQKVLRVFENDRNRLSLICGLVVHGRIIRGQVRKAGITALAKKFDWDDLRITASLRELHNDSQRFDIDLSRLDELVLRAGKMCLTQWRAGLNRQMQLRVDLMDRPHIEDVDSSLEIGIDYASAVVNAVCLRLALKN